MKQQTMVAMMATNRRMEEAMPAKVVGLNWNSMQRFCSLSVIILKASRQQ